MFIVITAEFDGHYLNIKSHCLYSMLHCCCCGCDVMGKCLVGEKIHAVFALCAYRSGYIMMAQGPTASRSLSHSHTQ